LVAHVVVELTAAELQIPELERRLIALDDEPADDLNDSDVDGDEVEVEENGEVALRAGNEEDGTEENAGEDSAEGDSGEEDNADEDDADEDTAEEDTAEEDSAEEDSREADGAQEDSAEEDGTEEESAEEECREEDDHGKEDDEDEEPGTQTGGRVTALPSRVTAALLAKTLPTTLAPVFNVLLWYDSNVPTTALFSPSVADVPTAQ
jgi:cobalamin biosynthesis protein CobT